MSGPSPPIIVEILKGERDPCKLADLKHEMVKASREEVARSLEGNWRADLLFELRQAVDSYHFAHQQMRECDRKLQSFLASLPTRTLERPSQSGDAPAHHSKSRCGLSTASSYQNGISDPATNANVDLRTVCNPAADILCSATMPAINTGVTRPATGTLCSGTPTNPTPPTPRYTYNDGDGSTCYDVEYPIQMHGFDPNAGAELARSLQTHLVQQHFGSPLITRDLVASLRFHKLY